MKTTHQLASIREAANAWRDPDLWNYAEVDGTSIRFDDAQAGISEEAAAIIQLKLSRGKLAASAINPDQLAFTCCPIYGSMAGRVIPFPRCLSVSLSV